MYIRGLRSRFVGPVDLVVRAAQCVCLSGASGTGKTLLLRAIVDLDPHDGDIYLDDKPCTSFSAPEWRHRVALLMAESRWWHESVGEHFEGRRVDPAWLERLGFDPVVLQSQVSRLSTGERQRLALLRLLCNRPDVLLLDEPTASLDPDNTAAVESLIADYRRRHDAAVLWVSHDPEQIHRVAQQHVHLDANVFHEEALP